MNIDIIKVENNVDILNEIYSVSTKLMTFT
jgi:hypothetical protein